MQYISTAVHLAIINSFIQSSYAEEFIPTLADSVRITHKCCLLTPYSLFDQYFFAAFLQIIKHQQKSELVI